VVTTEALAVFDPATQRWERVPNDFLQVLASFRLNGLTGAGWPRDNRRPQTPHEFYEAAQAHQQFLSHSFMQMIFFAPPIVFNFQQSIGTIKTAALASLDPAPNSSDAVMASFQINSPKAKTGDELEPIMDAPTFPQAMYEALREPLAGFHFSRSGQGASQHRASCCRRTRNSSNRFWWGSLMKWAANCCGAAIPTDQRGTYFRQFWDTRTALKPERDIPPINEWEKRELGTTAVGRREATSWCS
jgi:hypothetical protein